MEWSLLLSCFLAAILCFSSSQAQNPISTWCNVLDSDNYTSNGSFETNLNTLLSNLSSSAPSSSGFLTSTAGSAPERVYGLALCRGDANSSICRFCLDKASSDLFQNCSYKKDAMVWYDECFLQYANTQFVSSADYGHRMFLRNSNNISSTDVAEFNNSVLAVLRGLRSYAVSSATRPQLFAAGEMDMGGLGGFERLYGLVQCTRDISAGDCNVCLEAIFKDLPSCCPNAIGGRVLTATCNFRYEVYHFNSWRRRIVFPRSSTPPPVLPPFPSSPPDKTEKKKYSTGVVLAITLPIGVLVILLISIGCFCLHMRRKTQLISDGRLHDDATTESLVFNHAAIIRVTNNFSNKLGEGGYGAVYKGTLPGGQEIAVKRIFRDSFQGAEQLKNEVALLAKLEHRNLVRILGVCLERDEKLLIYEFVANKSLDIILFDSERKEQLNWEARLKIITGVARGLLYLHEESRVTIIHRILKAGNILLDYQMNPKISDFGTARLFLGDQTHASTNIVIGTFGYMSPEYVTRGQFSYKSDIFNFGILVLEIITGRKRSDFCNFENSEFSVDLLSYVWEHWSSGSVARIVDPSLRGNYENDEAQRCIHIALLCVQEQPADRPMMSTIVLMLNSSSVSMNVPTMPAFATDYRRMVSRRQALANSVLSDESNGSNAKSGIATPNDTSITELEPR